MTVIAILACSAFAAVLAWRMARARGAAALARLDREMRAEMACLQAELTRARARAAQLAREHTIWADARRQGCADALACMSVFATDRQRSVPVARTLTEADA